MPSKGRSGRKRKRSKTQEMQGVHSRLAACEAGRNENPAVGSNRGGDNPGHEAIMAAMPQPVWQAFLRGLQAETRYSLVRMWAHKRFGILVLAFWALLLLCYFLSSGSSDSVSSDEYTLRSNENDDGQSLEEASVWGALSSFFFPTTCIVKENQVVKPCRKAQDIKESECLKYKCCFSSVVASDFSCFSPIRDKPTQMFRLFGLGVISMIILGCLLICCCSLCQRSKWANPLRRKVDKILKDLKKQRDKLKDTEMIAMEGDEEDEKEQETRALVLSLN
ncbi:fragile X mental retardation 1 neighbor protein [Tupaia chinensis]|uniref:fragile X mental retardation 1 neighbor protein n=1 Tax=Tupaia chinensis TaxID=246437 RepID=UPI0003C8CD18|nr:fragile X mental retardation 1 neighbor protein [Tupaia chinensis]